MAEFEPHRVQCTVCKSWVKLRHDCSYSLGKWLLHRRRCGQQTRELLTSHSSNSGDAVMYVPLHIFQLRLTYRIFLY